MSWKFWLALAVLVFVLSFIFPNTPVSDFTIVKGLLLLVLGTLWFHPKFQAR